jgi:two-component SAPR family response regulator
MTINNTHELLELIQKENVSHELASKITSQYLNVLDTTTSKHNLIKEVERIKENRNGINQFVILTDHGNPLN